MKTQLKKWFLSAPVSTEKNAYTITDEDGIYIAEMFSLGKDSGQAEPEDALKNAKIAAAAVHLLEACEYVIDYHRENDSGSGELFGLDFVTTCINAVRKTKE